MRSSLYRLALSLFSFLLLTCIGQQPNPFQQSDANIAPVLENSFGQTSDSTISDTVGNRISIGIRAYLPSFIDSVRVVVHSGSTTDTSFTFGKNSDWASNPRIVVQFRSAGTRTASFTVFIGSSEKLDSAIVKILPRLINITTKSSNDSVTQNDSVTFTAGVSDSGIHTFKWYKDTTAISGATYATLTINPVIASSAGSYTCLIRDHYGDTARTPAAVLTLKAIRAVPKWAHDTIRVEVSEGTVNSLNLADSCTVSNGATVKYSLKTGGTVADSLSGSVWKYAPTFTDSGSYTIQIQAATATDSSVLTMLLHVANVNRAPQFDAGKPLTSYAVKGGALLSFAVNATDLDGDSVSYFVKSSTLPRSAPALAGKTVTWQSVSTDSANAVIVLGAYDWKDTTLITVQVAVGKVNAAPSLGAQYLTQTVSKGQTIRVYEGDSAKFTFTVTDPDSGQAHVLKIADRTPLSCGTVVFDSVNYKFSFVPSFSCATKDSILLSNVVFVVTDNGVPPLSDTLKVNFNVINVDRAPVLMVVHDTTVFQSKPLNFMAQAVDPDNDAVTITATGLSSAVLPDSAKFDPKTGILSWTPNFNQTGTFYIVFTASDGTLTTKDTTTIIVTKTDRPPVAVTQSVNAGRNTAKTIILTATDPDTDPITQFKITKVASNGSATLSDPVAGTVTYTPTTGFIGIDTFSFSASDGSLWSLTSANVTITVDSNKVAPKITTEPRIDTTINQGGAFSITVATNNAFPSPTYSWYQGIKGSGALKGTTSNPVYSKVGVAAVDSGNYYVIASNTFGADTSAYAHLKVNVPPSAPTLSAPANSAIGVTISPTLTWSTVTGAVTYRVQVSTASDFSSGMIVDDSTLTSATKVLPGLSNNTQYYWRVSAINAGGASAWSTVFSFTTIVAAPGVPVLSAPASGATGVAISPTLSWNPAGGAATYRVQVSTASDFSTGIIADDSTLTTVTKALSGLTNNTLYYWHVCARNAATTSAWSSIFSFTTLYVFTVAFDGQSATVAPIPLTKTVTAPATTLGALPSDPQKTGYLFGGWYTATNGAGTAFTALTTVTQSMTVYAKWIPVYAVTYDANGSANGTVPVDPNTYTNGTTVSVLDNTGSLIRTGYTFTCWNTNAAGTGTDRTPGGTFSMGAANVTLYAKWTAKQYTVTYDANGGTGAPAAVTQNYLTTFAVASQGALAKTSYVFNGWNTKADSSGTSYPAGSQYAIGTKNDTLFAKWVIKDVDGNIYTEVVIGTQTWMVQNLKTTKFNDGTQIPNVTDGTTWSALTTSGYCWYNNSIDSGKIYGALFNWYAVNTGKLAPAGWHVPSDLEWTTLATFLGGESIAGDKLKEAGGVHWAPWSDGHNSYPNTGTNSSGFTALPGGDRDYGSNDGIFGNVGWDGNWWSSTGDASFAWIRSLANNPAAFVNRNDYGYLTYGFSVRCLKN